MQRWLLCLTALAGCYRSAAPEVPPAPAEDPACTRARYADGLAAVAAMVRAGDELFFAEKERGAIWKVKLGGRAGARLVAAPSPDAVDVTALAVAGGRLYWLRESDGALWSSELDGRRPRRIEIPGVVRITAAEGALFAVGAGGVYRVERGAPALILEHDDLHNLAVDGGSLYAAHQRDILRVPLGGGEAVLHARLEHEIGELLARDGTLVTAGHVAGEQSVSILRAGAKAWLHIRTPDEPHALQWNEHGIYFAAERSLFRVRGGRAEELAKLSRPEDSGAALPLLVEGAALYVADGVEDGRFAVRRICHAP